MRRLDDSEWLHVARRLPVGSSLRINHGCGSTPALNVYSEPTKLSAHCFRCKAWGLYQLEHRRPVQAERVSSKTLNLPNDYLYWDAVPEYDQYFILQWIVQKGLDPNMLPLKQLRYSQRHYRLAFPILDGQYKARALGDDFPKWSHYSSTGCYADYLELKGNGKSVVLVEDMLSAYKVRYSTGFTTYAILGTNVSPALSALLEQQFQVGAIEYIYIMLDGDEAGRSGALRAYRNFRFKQMPVSIVKIPDELDPKDLWIGQLRKLTER